MATVRELFDGEFGHLTKVQGEVTGDPPTFKAIEQLYLGFAEYAKLLGYYVPEESATPDFMAGLIAQYENTLARRGLVAISGRHPANYEDEFFSSAVPFTGRVIMYVDAALADTTKQSLVAFGSGRSLRVQIRDRTWSDFITSQERPLGFISHDSRDKDGLVRNLAERLRSALCPVWYDEFSIRPGDSITASVDAGLRDSKRCVVVLSPNYMENEGWARGEFNAIVNQRFSGGKGIIPIWHGVSREQVAEYSPLIADTRGINTNLGEDEVFNQLHRALLVD